MGAANTSHKTTQLTNRSNSKLSEQPLYHKAPPTLYATQNSSTVSQQSRQIGANSQQQFQSDPKYFGHLTNDMGKMRSHNSNTRQKCIVDDTSSINNNMDVVGGQVMSEETDYNMGAAYNLS